MNTKNLATRDSSESRSIYRQIALFFGLTILISWGVLLTEIFEVPIKLPEFFLILVGYGPAIAAIIMAINEQGWAGLRSLLFRLGIIRVGWVWYALVLLGPWAFFLSALGLAGLFGVQVDLSKPAVLQLAGSEISNPWVLLVPAFLYLLITLLGEEIGWRGYALPRLLKNYNELTAGLILGLAWGVWHLPMAWAPALQAGINHLPLGWFLVDIIAMSMLYIWIFVNTRGSLLIALLLHTTNNLAAMYLPVLPPAAPGNQIFFLLLAFKWVLVLAILIKKGTSNWHISNRRIQ